MPKAARPIIINTKRYNPIDETEIEEDLAPVKELAKEFQVCDRDVQEKITNAKLTVDENGKRVLVLTGYVSKKDRSKRMVKVGGEFDASNIVAGTRKRKNVNYKSLEEKASKPASKNSFDKRSKLTEKMNKKKAAAKKESEDKENVENQMADDEDIAAEKKTTKKKEEWTYPLSKKNHDLLKKLGGVIKNKLPIRKFRDTEIPAPINAFVSVKFPKNVRFTITKKCVGKNSFGQIEHCLFDLSDNELPQWFKDNEDAVILGESENGLVCAKMSDANSNFKVYIIFEAIEDGEEEMVFEMSLNKYLSNLKKVKVDVPEEEEETAEEQPAATTSEEQTETAQEESTPSQEEDAPIVESQELVEQSLASDAALNEKVDIMED